MSSPLMYTYLHIFASSHLKSSTYNYPDPLVLKTKHIQYGTFSLAGITHTMQCDRKEGKKEDLE